MPELPEVEVTRRSCADRIASAHILALQLGKPLRWPLGVPAASLVGRQIWGVRRRGKYLLLDLDQGLLLVHLGMSGSLNFAPVQPEAGPHDHMDLVTDRGVLRLHDPRRFGAVVWAPGEDSPQAQKLLGRLGVEPLSGQFDVTAFAQALKKRQSAIKQVLLAGDEVVGVGNIYASEALFMAGIRPTTKASRLTKPGVARLHTAIIQVLNRAVEQGGSSLKDFVSAEGRTGYFQLEAAVYGRAGEPCRVCTTSIKSMLQGQRTTFYCPTCQKP